MQTSFCQRYRPTDPGQRLGLNTAEGGLGCRKKQAGGRQCQGGGMKLICTGKVECKGGKHTLEMDAGVYSRRRSREAEPASTRQDSNALLPAAMPAPAWASAFVLMEWKSIRKPGARPHYQQACHSECEPTVPLGGQFWDCSWQVGMDAWVDCGGKRCLTSEYAAVLFRQ